MPECLSLKGSSLLWLLGIICIVSVKISKHWKLDLIFVKTKENCASCSSSEMSNSAPEANFAKVKISIFFKKKIFLRFFHVSKLRGNTVDFKNINIIDWGDIPNFDLVINATSVGLKKEDKINLDFSNVGKV